MYDISIRTVMLGKLTVARLSAVSCCIVILTGCLIVFDMAVMGQSTNQVTERKETVIRLIDTADSLIKIQLVESARPYVQQAQELKDQYQMELTYSQLLTLAQSWADVFEPMRGSAIIRTLLLTIPEGDRVKRCVLNDKLARYVNQTGQFQEAETMFRKNLATAELNGLDSCKALAYWGLSISLGAMQQEDEQIRAAKSMAWIARRNNFTELEAIAYYMAGYGYYQAKKSDLAIENLEKSVRISELAGLPLRTLAAHMLIAWVYYTEGHKTQAISWYRASLELARSSRQKTNHCNILGRIGTIY